jgi:hypothetical protein
MDRHEQTGLSWRVYRICDDWIGLVIRLPRSLSYSLRTCAKSTTRFYSVGLAAVTGMIGTIMVWWKFLDRLRKVWTE